MILTYRLNLHILILPPSIWTNSQNIYTNTDLPGRIESEWKLKVDGNKIKNERTILYSNLMLLLLPREIFLVNAVFFFTAYIVGPHTHTPKILNNLFDPGHEITVSLSHTIRICWERRKSAQIHQITLKPSATYAHVHTQQQQPTRKRESDEKHTERQKRHETIRYERLTVAHLFYSNIQRAYIYLWIDL